MDQATQKAFQENQIIFQEAVKNGELVKSNEIGNYIIKKTNGEATVTYKDGSIAKIPIETTYTIYESGRKDCHVDVIQPIDSGSVPLQPRGMEKGDK